MHNIVQSNFIFDVRKGAVTEGLDAQLDYLVSVIPENSMEDPLTKFARAYMLFGEQGGGAAATVFSRMKFNRSPTPCDLRGANEISSVQRQKNRDFQLKKL